MVPIDPDCVPSETQNILLLEIQAVFHACCGLVHFNGQGRVPSITMLKLAETLLYLAPALHVPGLENRVPYLIFSGSLLDGKGEVAVKGLSQEDGALGF